MSDNRLDKKWFEYFDTCRNIGFSPLRFFYTKIYLKINNRFLYPNAICIPF